jgi:drug/metabolite transporter (DMT)-like permease
MSVEMTPRQWIGAFLIGLAAAVIVVGQFTVRMHDVDASETRLVVDYWWLWLSAFVIASIGIWLTGERT